MKPTSSPSCWPRLSSLRYHRRRGPLPRLAPSTHCTLSLAAAPLRTPSKSCPPPTMATCWLRSGWCIAPGLGEDERATPTEEQQRNALQQLFGLHLKEG